MSDEQTCYLIFVTDGRGTTQLAHTYAETLEQATLSATRWRDETYPELTIIKVRAEPNGYLFGHTIQTHMNEEKTQ